MDEGKPVPAGGAEQGASEPGAAPEASLPGVTAVPAPPVSPAAEVPGGPVEPSGGPSSPSPWQYYDPWAPRAPFQQNGAEVLSEEQRLRRGRKAFVLAGVLIALVSGGVG